MALELQSSKVTPRLYPPAFSDLPTLANPYTSFPFTSLDNRMPAIDAEIAPESSKSHQKSSKSSRLTSHRYFSRLSKRFFKSPRRSSTNTKSSDEFKEPTKDPSLKSSKRLCSVRKKSNHFFAAQARFLSTSPPLTQSKQPQKGGRE